MKPSLIYNGYHVQRRKMYIENPRHNLFSTIDMTWKQSLDEQSKQIKNPYLSKLQKQKEFQQRRKQDTYNEYVHKQIQQQLKLDQSTFRVIPIENKHPLQSKYYSTAANNPEAGGNPTQSQQLYNISKTISYDENYNKYQRKSNQQHKNSFVQNPNDNGNIVFGKNRQPEQYNAQKQFNFQRQYKNLYSSGRQIQGNHFPSIYAMPSSPNKYTDQGKSSRNVARTMFGYQLNNHIKVPYQGRDSYLSKIYIGDALQPFLRQQNKSYQRHQSLSINHPIKLNY